MIYRLITWLLCGLWGVGVAWLVTRWVPLPDSARSVLFMLVTVAATSFMLWLYRSQYGRW